MNCRKILQDSFGSKIYPCPSFKPLMLFPISQGKEISIKCSEEKNEMLSGIYFIF